MQISKILIDFINDKENKELLNNFKFKELYEKLRKLDFAACDIFSENGFLSKFTALMYEAKINPLLYLDEVPERFLWRNVNIKNVDIPSNINSIGKQAFYDCDGLTSITIGNSVTSIGDYAFSNCSSLTSITIPDSMTSIGDYAFWNCSSLISIAIPDNVTYIGTAAFRDCRSLTSITIGNGVAFIGNFVFDCCLNLTINYRGRKEQWDQIRKGSDWKIGSKIKVIHCTDGDINVK